MTTAEKEKQLKKLAQQIQTCEECKDDSVGVMVFGEGNPDAKVMFVGEAPGKNEAREGRPFIGRSGKYLRSLIEKIGFKPEDVYITSPVKYLPAKGTPTPKQITHAKEHFLQQVEIIKPQILVLMGSFAAQGALHEKIPVKTRHGEVIEKDGRKYFITLHPAAGMRFPPFKKLIEDDFKKLKELIKN